MDERMKYGIIGDLVALCNLMDEFVGFDKRMISFVDNSSKIELKRIVDILSSENIELLKGTKLYNDNKEFIDKFNQYSDIMTFLWNNYICNGYDKNNDIYKFYNYFNENRDSLNEILAVLNKLKELEFSELSLHKNYDLTKAVYSIGADRSSRFMFKYLDNIEIIPSYDGTIKYRSSGSNYVISISEFCILNYKIITLNTLIFDSERLPDVMRLV